MQGLFLHAQLQLPWKQSLRLNQFFSTAVIKGQRSVKNEAGESVVIEIPLNTYTYTFSTIPTNDLEELKQYNISGDDGRYKVLSGSFMSCRFGPGNRKIRQIAKK